MEKVHQTGSKLAYKNVYSDSDGDKHEKEENLSISEEKDISFKPKIKISSQSLVNKSKGKFGKKTCQNK